MSTSRTQTRRIELVETGNIAISISRISKVSGWQSSAIKRAIYHAITMANCLTSDEESAVRQALKLP